MQRKKRTIVKRKCYRHLLFLFIVFAGTSGKVIAAEVTVCQPCAPVVIIEEVCPPSQGIPVPVVVDELPSSPGGPRPSNSQHQTPSPRSSDSPSPGDRLFNENTETNQDFNLSENELNSVADQVASSARTSRLASTTGTRGGLDAPNMLGDFFGGTFLQRISESNREPLGSTVALAGGDRRFKISENTSPIPRDRIFTNYNHFHRALTDINGDKQNLDRFTFGFEKTFWSKQALLEMRLPIGNGLNSSQDYSVPIQNTTNSELGNLALALKFVLLSNQDSVLSAGVTSTVPTGDDYVEYYGDSFQTRIKNNAVHLAPFLGYFARPSENWFFQSYLQVDTDLNGNNVYINNDRRGAIQDQTLLFFDGSLGRWLHRRQDSGGNVFGTAFIGELHYTSTLNDTDSVYVYTNPYNRMDILNATAGLHFQAGLSSLRVAMGAPLRRNEEALFDTEVQVQFNRRF